MLSETGEEIVGEGAVSKQPMKIRHIKYNQGPRKFPAFILSILHLLRNRNIFVHVLIAMHFCYYFPFSV